MQQAWLGLLHMRHTQHGSGLGSSRASTTGGSSTAQLTLGHRDAKVLLRGRVLLALQLNAGQVPLQHMWKHGVTRKQAGQLSAG